MNTIPPNLKIARVFAALLVFVGGLLCLVVNTRLGSELRFASFDWLHDFAHARCAHASAAASDVVILYLDEASHKALNQPFNVPWNRALHAKLLNRLTQDGASAVVFDVVFSDPGPDAEADAALAQAIRKNGRVILAADIVDSKPTVNSSMSSYESSLTPPYTPFLKAAASWGFSQLQPDEDFLVREHRHAMAGSEAVSLTWAAGQLLKLPATQKSEARFTERWINYYGQPGTIPSISYRMAFEMPTNYFRNKVVFIGGHPSTALLRERRDEFRNPYATWFQEPVFMPAVEVHATTYLNLADRDWLRRLAPAYEWLALLAGALFFGSALLRHSPGTAVGVALAGILVFGAMVSLLFGVGGYWFDWLIVAAVQAPIGLLCSISYKSREWYKARKEAQARIREQAALLDKARDAIMVLTPDGRITYWNPGAQQLYGWSLAELKDPGAGELLFIGTQSDYTKILAVALATGQWTGQLEQTTRTGRKITVESRWSSIASETGPPTLLVINTDITEKKKLEAQLWRAQRLESIGTLAGGLAHDLNNFLTPILMSSQVLQAQEQDEKKRRALQVIELSAKQGAGVAKEVLTFVRGCEGEMVALQVKHVVREIAKFASETFPKSIRIETRIAPNIFHVRGNANQLHQVLLNLLVNARDAMPKGGTIFIEALNASGDEVAASVPITGQTANYVLLRVSDTGVGIAPEIIDRIFDPFFTTKPPGKGTGLGLSTVMGIVKSHQGCVNLTSHLGQGTTFWIFLPAVDLAIPETPASTLQDFEGLRGQGQSVLVLDRDPLTRGMIELLLIDNNYQAIQVNDARRVVEVLAESEPKIALGLFDSSTLETSETATPEAIQKNFPALKMVMMGGNSQAKSPFKTLPKPFTARELLETVRRSIAS